MHLRKTALSVVCLLTAAFSYAQPGTDYLFQVSGAESGSGRVLSFLANDSNLLPEADTTGPLNVRTVVPLPSGQGFYMIGDGPLQFLAANLQNFQTLNAVQGPIDHVKLSPDGKYLFVFGAQVYVVNTATNTVVATNSTLSVDGIPVDVAFSHDSKKAWLLQSFAGAGVLRPIDLTNLTVLPRVDIARSGLSIAMSPKGRLYIASSGQIDEYKVDPIEHQASIFMSAKPGPLQFTPDGSRAYFVNQTPEISGYSVIYFQTAERDLNGWNNPPLSPRFDELLIASPERLYGLERSTHRLWQMDLANHAMSVSDVAGVYDAHNIVAAAISQERPSARFLYLLEDSAGLPKMKRVDALTNTLQVESPATSTSGLFQFAPIPPQSGASQFIKINDNQVLPGGGVALPIGAYILDSFGRPVFNQTVSFTSTDSNVSFATPAATTNSDGFVETGVGIPLVPGAYTITLSAQGATTNFSIVVPGGDGGVPGGSPLISIVRGDGQLLRENQTTSFFAPLTVLIVDEHGAPRAGVPVTFSLASGVGGLTTPNVITSDAGLASTLYRSPAISQQLAFQDIVVRATSEVGSVEFHEITHKIDGTGFGEPQYLNPLNPQFPTQWPSFITVGRGDLIPNFFTYQVKTRHPFLPAAPIPNVKLRFAQDADETLDGPGRCVNNTATDQNGVGHCDLKLSCDLEGDPYVRMMIGERIGVKMRLLVGPASSQSLTYVSGNNQAGIAGQTLPSALVAQIGDNCGGGLAGREVVWTVTQGAATLTQVATTSNAAGLVSARVVLGSTPGPVKVSVVMANADPIIFDLANNAVISGVQVVSGGAQTALTNQAFANPLVFVVRDNLNNPVGAGYNVVFTTTGSVVLDTNQATTDAQGRVQVLATAGPLAGPVTVRATHAGFSATAQLTVGTPPPPSLPLTPASFYNNASFNTPNKAEGMTPCGLVTVIGNGLASTVAGVVSGVGFGPMPYTLAGVSLTVNGVPAPLRAVSNVDGEQRVDFQAPCETAVGTATVVITVNGGTTTINGVKVFAGQPGIFSYKWSDNKNYGAVVRVKDGSYITPSNLAVTGEDYLMFVTGLGQTTPATATNSAGVGQSVALQVVVGVDDGGVPQQQARYVPGLIGVYSVQFTLPKRDGVPAGATILSRQGTQTINFALAVVVNGQVIFGNPLLLPGMIQGQ